MEYFNNFDNIDGILKIIISVIAIITSLSKLKRFFSSLKRKQELIIDLEILEKVNNNQSLNINEIQSKINESIKKVYLIKPQDFTNFLWGIALFIGFGFWTIDILSKYQDFNPWAILTFALSLIGLSISIGNDDQKVEQSDEIPFIKIGLYSKTDFRFSIIIFILTFGIISIMLWKQYDFNFWYLLPGSFCIMSAIKIFSLFKIIK